MDEIEDIIDEKPERSFAKFNRTLQKAYLEKISAGINVYAASEQVGISRPTIIDFTKTHPSFQEEINEAIIKKHQLVKDSLLRQACSDKNITATMFYLQNKCSDEFSDRRKQDITINQSSEGMSVEELKKELEARGIKI